MRWSTPLRAPAVCPVGLRSTLQLRFQDSRRVARGTFGGWCRPTKTPLATHPKAHRESHLAPATVRQRLNRSFEGRGVTAYHDRQSSREPSPHLSGPFDVAGPPRTDEVETKHAALDVSRETPPSPPRRSPTVGPATFHVKHRALSSPPPNRWAGAPPTNASDPSPPKSLPPSPVAASKG